MKWFGKSWNAPVCLPKNHVKTPRENCYLCEHEIVPGQTGIVLPFGGPPEDPRTEVALHLRCYIEGLVTNKV